MFVNVSPPIRLPEGLYRYATCAQMHACSGELSHSLMYTQEQ